MLTKKKTLYGSLLALAIFFVSVYSVNVGLCSVYNHSCLVVFDTIAAALLIFIPVFLLTLLTYRMRDSVFDQWMKFAVWYVPIDMVLAALIFLWASNGMWGGLGLMVAGSISVTVILGLLGIFTVVSLIIIIRKYFATRHGK